VSSLREILPPDTALAFEAMRALRTHLQSAERFAAQVDEVQRPEGYRLVGAFEENEERALAVAGFRVVNHLAWGRTLYVDDLSTLFEARNRGYGARLLEWCEEEARRAGCDELHLDSGVGPERLDAHRLYFNRRLGITSFHFAKSL
jgi:GNAT superfamily N-acetyltransferase